MTDRRLGDALPALIAAMPPRSGVIVRPYAMDPKGRTATIRAIRRICRAKRHVVLIAARDGRGFDGVHAGGANRQTSRVKVCGLLSMPVHDEREAARARRLGADLCLISPVLPTRSHPGGTALGQSGLARLARQIGPRAKALALGGMDAARFPKARRQGAYGWVAIDAWLPTDARP